MTISANVRKELFEMTANEGKLIRIKPTEAKAGTTVYSSKQAQPLKMWTQEEHEKFLEAMEKYPAGPWKVIAAFIGTKTTRQTMTHAQKYRQKIGRWRRGLRHKGRKQAADSADAAKDNLFKAIEYVSSDEMSCYGGNDASPARSAAGSVNDERSELFRLAELASIEGMKQEPPSPQPFQQAQQEHHQQQFQPQQQQFQPQQQQFQPQPQQQFQPQQPHFGPSQAGMVVVPASPADVEMADMSRIQIKQESVEYDNYHFKLKQQMEWEHREAAWRGRHTPEIKLSPLRGVSGVEGRVLNAISGMSFLNAQHQVPLPLPASRAPSPERDMSDDECSTRAFRSASGAFRLPPLNIAAQSGSAFAIPPLRTKIDPSVLQFAPTH